MFHHVGSSASGSSAPPRTTTTTPTEYFKSHDNGIIHIFYSRFMQGQHNLTQLGLARFQIFKLFCFPTMIRQTNQHFLWIIQTDPRLDSNITKLMIDLLNPYPNYILLSSNTNDKNGFRHLNAHESDLFNAVNLLSRDLSLLRTVHTMPQTRVVLETRLDADDGLNILFVETIQNDASEIFWKSKNASSSLDGRYTRQEIDYIHTSRWCVCIYTSLQILLIY